MYVVNVTIVFHLLIIFTHLDFSDKTCRSLISINMWTISNVHMLTTWLNGHVVTMRN